MEDLIRSDTNKVSKDSLDNDIIRNDTYTRVNENNCKTIKMYIKNLLFNKKLKGGGYNDGFN